MYVAFVRINSGTNNKRSLIRCSPASLIFSTVWGFDAASATGARRKRRSYKNKINRVLKGDTSDRAHRSL